MATANKNSLPKIQNLKKKFTSVRIIEKKRGEINVVVHKFCLTL